MNKKNMLLIIIEIVFPIVFNLFFFLLGNGEKLPAEWVAYAFIHIAYIILVIAPYTFAKGTNPVVMGMPLQTISFIYFLAVLVFGIIIFAANPEKVVFTVLFEAVLFGIFVIIFVSAVLANENTSESVANQKAEVSYIKEISSKIKSLESLTNDERIVKSLERLYDIAHSSPSKTSGQCSAIESNIIDSLSSLEMIIFQADSETVLNTIGRIANLLNERNRILQSTY